MRTLALRVLLLLGMMAFCVPTASSREVFVSVVFAPPALPVYEQPICPGEGYIWTPGYWAYADDDYYWVPGTWVLAPEVGFLWTPPYWAFVNGAYFFHEGYWGPHVGFYGGVVYGFGYFGRGYEGGRWDGGRFYYNRSVTNVNVTVIHNVYNTRVTEVVNHVSYNGGPGGINARPRREEEEAARERHIGAPSAQARHVEEARSNRELRASANAGRPPIAATPRPAEFNDRAVVRAREAGGPYHPEANRADSRAARPNGNDEARRPESSAARPSTAIHPRELPPAERPAAPNTGNAKQDEKYRQQQDKLWARQEQEHQKLQQKQEQDHQRLAQQRASEEQRQQLEQRHQQQTARMEQQHSAQQEKLQRQQQPPPSHNESKPQGGRPERP